jgi:uncharacterized protein YgiM (DUF1202 family)
LKKKKERKKSMRKIFRAVAAIVVSALFVASAQPNTVSAANRNVDANQGVTLTVTSETANIRSGPSTGDTILGVVTKGATLVADAKTADGSWYRVNYNGKSAFIFAQLVSTGGAASATAPQPAQPAAPAQAAGAQSVVVKSPSGVLNVRSGPGTTFQILGTTKNGQALAATAKTQDNQWLRVTFNGKEAYVFAAYTTFGSAAAPAASAPKASAPTAPAPAPAPVASAGTFEVGAHIKEPERLDLMTSSGMNWVKYQVVFDGGAPDISGLINQLHGAGTKILVGAVGNRQRVDDPNYHKEFAQGLAAIARQGADAIEVWNEPNLPREFGSDGAGKVSPENFTNMLREAWGAIKSANGGTMVVGGAMAPTGYWGGGCSSQGCDDKPFLERIASLGAGNYMDCQGAHFNGSPNAPDVRSGGPTGDHYTWYFWGTFDTTYNAIRKPICFTEMGYVTKDGIAGSLPSGFAWGNNITLQNQADWSGRLVTLLRSSGRARLAIFWNWNFRKFDDDPQSGYSLLRPDGSCPACGSIRSAMGR